MTVANLRGVRESGSVFAPPTYLYVVMLILLIVVGLYRIFVQDLGPIPPEMLSEEARELAAGHRHVERAVVAPGVQLGCGGAVRAWRRCRTGFPRSAGRRAATRRRRSRSWARSSATTFLGVSVLAAHLHPYRGEDDPTGIALMAEWIYGGKGFLFWITQLATFAILILAANTAYADFPRLSSIIARDGFLPRQLANRGDKLVFSNGIIFLALVAGLLIVVFKGNIAALIPLYAFGVFTGFTLSQAGMVVHHFRLREPRWRPSAAINAVGCVATGVVAVRRGRLQVHGGGVDPGRADPGDGAGVPGDRPPLPARPRRRGGGHRVHAVRASTHLVVVLVGGVNRGVIEAVQYARSLAPERLIAVSVVATPEEQEAIADAWDAHRMPVPLHTISSPVPGADPPRARVPRRARGREPRRRDHGRDPRVRHRLEAAVAPQPIGAGVEGAPALPPEHGGDIGARPRRPERSAPTRRPRAATNDTPTASIVGAGP